MKYGEINWNLFSDTLLLMRNVFARSGALNYKYLHRPLRVETDAWYGIFAVRRCVVWREVFICAASAPIYYELEKEKKSESDEESNCASSRRHKS